jgi:hypothetical protein
MIHTQSGRRIIIWIGTALGLCIAAVIAVGLLSAQVNNNFVAINLVVWVLLSIILDMSLNGDHLGNRDH